MEQLQNHGVLAKLKELHKGPWYLLSKYAFFSYYYLQEVQINIFDRLPAKEKLLHSIVFCMYGLPRKGLILISPLQNTWNYLILPETLNNTQFYIY